MTQHCANCWKKISWGSCQLYLEFIPHFGYPVFEGYSISTVGTVLYCLVIFVDQQNITHQRKDGATWTQQKNEMNSGAPDGQPGPAQLVAPYLEINETSKCKHSITVPWNGPIHSWYFWCWSKILNGCIGPSQETFHCLFQ